MWAAVNEVVASGDSGARVSATIGSVPARITAASTARSVANVAARAGPAPWSSTQSRMPVPRHPSARVNSSATPSAMAPAP